MVPCSTISPVHQNWALQNHLFCGLHVPYGCHKVLFSFSLVSFSALTCVLWAGFCPYIVKGAVLGYHRLKVGQCQQLDHIPTLSIYQGHTKLQGILPELSLERFSFMGSIWRQTRCLPLLHLSGLQWPKMSPCTTCWEVFFGGWSQLSDHMHVPKPSVETVDEFIGRKLCTNSYKL